MKIIAQSTQASGSPYIHLGYTSATPRNPPMALLSGVIIFLGISMAYRLADANLTYVRRNSIKLVLGGYAVIILGCMGLLWSWPHPSYSERREAWAVSHMKGTTTAVLAYAASWDHSLPLRLADAVTDNELMMLDPREPPPAAVSTTARSQTRRANADAQSDFYYAGAGAVLNKIPKVASFILLYDHPDAGKNRIIAFADWHVEIVLPGADKLERFVEDSNKQRADLKLPRLPAALSGPPPAVQ